MLPITPGTVVTAAPTPNRTSCHGSRTLHGSISIELQHDGEVRSDQVT